MRKEIQYIVYKKRKYILYIVYDIEGISISKNINKSDVMEWMNNTQLGRRNLSPIQRIAVAEKYRPIYEKQAKERQATSTGGVNPQLTQNFVEADKNKKRSENETNAKLAKVANVNRETYRQAKRSSYN